MLPASNPAPNSLNALTQLISNNPLPIQIKSAATTTHAMRDHSSHAYLSVPLTFSRLLAQLMGESILTEGLCLRIYLSESSKIDGKPAMEAILALCQRAGLRGVSVLRGIEGLGQHGIHSASFLDLATNLPLLIEAIDTSERIEQAVELMKPHLGDCMVATWPVSLMRNGAHDGNA